MNYIAIKQECKGYLQGQKDRRISFDRLLKMAKQRHLYYMTTAVWRKGCIVVSHILIFLFLILLSIYYFYQKNVQEPFSLFYSSNIVYFIKITWKYVADSNNGIPVVTKLHKKRQHHAY